VVAGMLFNPTETRPPMYPCRNAYLLGTFIASNPLDDAVWHSPRFWLGLTGWAIGLAGNGEESGTTMRNTEANAIPDNPARQSTTTKSSMTYGGLPSCSSCSA
jgi:hypothetical protein